MILAAVARLATAKTKVAPAKFLLFEYSPQRYTRRFFTTEQLLRAKLLLGSAIATLIGSYYLPMLDRSSFVGAILLVLLGLLCYGGALLQVGLVLSFALEALVQRYPKLELWFSDTMVGNSLASFVCLSVFLVTLRIIESVVDPAMNWSSHLVLAYTFSVYFYAFTRLLIGAGLAVEHAGVISKKSRR
jgi:hypothetical protein